MASQPAARRPWRVLVLHGPNLNLLGSRRPELYGRDTLAEIDAALHAEAASRKIELETFQSNHEGALIDRIHAARGAFDALILNPGGLTHTSVALRDAIEAAEVPAVEVHLTNLAARESFRRRSLIAPVCLGQVAGFGPRSYIVGLHAAIQHLEETLR